jgi:hypothetical protein
MYGEYSNEISQSIVNWSGLKMSLEIDERYRTRVRTGGVDFLLHHEPTPKNLSHDGGGGASTVRRHLHQNTQLSLYRYPTCPIALIIFDLCVESHHDLCLKGQGASQLSAPP